MFSVPGVAALLSLIYLKPQEFIPIFEGLPLLYLVMGMLIVGVLMDLRLGHSKFILPPQSMTIVIYTVWCLVSRILGGGFDNFAGSAMELIIAVVLFFGITFGIQSFKGYETAIAVAMSVCLFITYVCFDQGFAPLTCAVQLGEQQEALRPDGRPCEKAEECYEGDAEPGANYQCERNGKFGTVSVGKGRVRYRGVLKDPNEVALTLGASVPFLFARVTRRSSIGRWLMLILGTLAVGTVIIFTQSRGGLLVLMAVLASYFAKRYGIKGIAIGAVMGAPLLALGGRSGDEADASSAERSELLMEGMHMIMRNPVYGVGYDRFTDHSPLTAHNSYMLAISETGVPGYFMFMLIVYMSVKIPVMVLKRYGHMPEAKIANIYAMMMIASLVSACIGSFFLSFTYHHALWILFGFSGALHTATKRHDPTFEVKVSLQEKLLVLSGSLGIIAVLRLVLKSKGF